MVNLATGIATPLLTGADVPSGVFTGPHGLDFIPAAVPEPASLALLVVGLAGLGLFRLRKSN